VNDRVSSRGPFNSGVTATAGAVLPLPQREPLSTKPGIQVMVYREVSDASSQMLLPIGHDPHPERTRGDCRRSGSQRPGVARQAHDEVLAIRQGALPITYFTMICPFMKGWMEQ
jgi:hypothetical protein